MQSTDNGSVFPSAPVRPLKRRALLPPVLDGSDESDDDAGLPVVVGEPAEVKHGRWDPDYNPPEADPHGFDVEEDGADSFGFAEEDEEDEEDEPVLSPVGVSFAEVLSPAGGDGAGQPSSVQRAAAMQAQLDALAREPPRRSLASMLAAATTDRSAALVPPLVLRDGFLCELCDVCELRAGGARCGLACCVDGVRRLANQPKCCPANGDRVQQWRPDTFYGKGPTGHLYVWVSGDCMACPVLCACRLAPRAGAQGVDIVPPGAPCVVRAGCTCPCHVSTAAVDADPAAVRPHWVLVTSVARDLLGSPLRGAAIVAPPLAQASLEYSACM